MCTSILMWSRGEREGGEWGEREGGEWGGGGEVMGGRRGG